MALLQLVKGDFPQGNMAYIFRIEIWKNYGYLLIKIFNLCLFFQILTIYSGSNNDFLNSPFYS